ncbi:ribosomal RNA large subunit methyltransferase F-like protein [Mycena sp. CBHHK59/15]|nr:ribosomal RNA large subunit methyltransferase F-like protein [Mycena sp. CBHHK59/15]
MHPRNPYRIPPDFRQLAQTYPPLQPCLVPSETGFTIDFKDEVAQKHLTEALLHRDFGISLSLPPGRLCPPVPNRLNYVLWIQDILQATGSAGPVHGVDIGTGASAIYPLLACKLEPDWSFITTDVDDVSLASARSNLAQNGLLARVDVVPTTTAAPVFAALSSPHARFDFTMCNPPFYSSLADVAASADAKALGPSAVCTGAYVEMITPGVSLCLSAA